MTLIGSKLVKGVRAQVYEVASKAGGFYHGEKDNSIYYDGNNLMINILFTNVKECSMFANELDSNLRYFAFLKQEDILIEPVFRELYLSQSPSSIFLRDYVTAEEDSENYSIAITRLTHITWKTTIDFETELMMIENPNHEDFVGLECYRCHLKSQKEFPAEKDNPNNMLWMSWPTHQRFDGLNTIENHRVPQIAIAYVTHSTASELFERGLERFRVTVAVVCPNNHILGIMRDRIKPGAKVLEKENKILTYVFVEDPVDFERCLTYKFNETQFLWTKKHYGEPVTREEAHNLRKSARLEAKRYDVKVESGRLK